MDRVVKFIYRRRLSQKLPYYITAKPYKVFNCRDTWKYNGGTWITRAEFKNMMDIIKRKRGI